MTAWLWLLAEFAVLALGLVVLNTAPPGRPLSNARTIVLATLLVAALILAMAAAGQSGAPR